MPELCAWQGARVAGAVCAPRQRARFSWRREFKLSTVTGPLLGFALVRHVLGSTKVEMGDKTAMMPAVCVRCVHGKASES